MVSRALLTGFWGSDLNAGETGSGRWALILYLELHSTCSESSQHPLEIGAIVVFSLWKKRWGPITGLSDCPKVMAVADLNPKVQV